MNWSSTRHLVEVRESLHGLRPLLAGIIRQSGAHFTGCGAVVSEFVASAGELRAQSERLSELSARASDPATSPVLAFAEASRAAVERSNTVGQLLERLGESLECHRSRLAGLIRDQQALLRVFAPMKSLKALFRIESAALEVGQAGAFAAVTQEIDRLDRKIRESFEAQLANLVAMEAEVAKATRRLASQGHELSSRAAEDRAAIEGILARVEEAAVEAGRSEHAVAHLAVSLDEELDRISYGVQQEDITRQRLEHIAQAVEQLAQGCRRRGFRRRAREMHLVSEVQVRQLEAIERDLEQAGQAIVDGLQRVEAARADHGVLNPGALGSGARELEEVVQRLADGHDNMRQTFAAGLAALREAVNETRRFAGTTSTSTAAMRRFSADLQLMGLNALVQAVQAGRGGLEVLSGEASRLSAEAGNAIREIDTRFHAASEALSKALSPAAAALEELEPALVSGAERATRTPLEAALRDQRDTLAEVTRLVHQVEECAEALRPWGTSPAFDRSAFSRCLAALRRVADCTHRHARRTGRRRDGTGLAQHYTMEAERSLHAAVLTRLTGSAPTPAPRTKGPSASVGELPGATAAANEAHPGHDNIEFF
ncbi:MAG: hypothetical protein ACLFU2_07090 [Opitutales bacterium]